MEPTEPQHELPPPPTEEAPFELDSQSREAFNRILILGVAARYSEIDAIRMRWDERRQIDGEPLQKVALDIVRRTYMVGMDRIAGDGLIRSIDHCVYDRLFEYFPDVTHEDFIERLSQMSDTTYKFFNIPDYTFSEDEIKHFRETQLLLMRAADQLFHDFFFSLATTDSYELPSKFENFVDHAIKPGVASLYFDRRYIAGMMHAYRTDRLRQMNESQEVRFYRWMLDQCRRIKAQRLGGQALDNT